MSLDVEGVVDGCVGCELADAGYDGKDDIEHAHGCGIEVFCPLPGSKGKPVDPAPKKCDGPGVIAWRAPMAPASDACFVR